MLNIYAKNKVSYQPKQPCSLISTVAICKQHVRTIRNVKEQDQSNFQKFSTYYEDFIYFVMSEDQRRGLLRCLFDHRNAFVTDENPNLGFTNELEHTNQLILHIVANLHSKQSALCCNVQISTSIRHDDRH